jgi:hypothetical protein
VIRYFFSVLNSHQLSFTGFAAALVAGLPPACNHTTTTEVKTKPPPSQLAYKRSVIVRKLRPIKFYLPPCHGPYSMRLSDHAGLQGAWDMRSGLACFEIVL